MKKLFSNRRSVFRILGIVLILVVIVLYIGFPSVMAVAVILPSGGSAGEPPEGFADVTLTTQDGLNLVAWYAEPQNGTVIILVHGAGGGRGSLRGHATMLYENGFGVLALNLRGFGDSDGRINRLGWNGTHDIGAAVDYLSGREGVEAIGGLGLSLGGEVLLGAASTYPAIQAVIADGATFRTVREYTSLPANRPLYRSFSQHVFSFMVSVFTGDEPPKPLLLESIQAAETKSFMFIAAGKDSTEVAYNEFFQETIPDRSAVWVIPDVGHTGGFSHDPVEYEQQVLSFFNEVFIRETIT